MLESHRRDKVRLDAFDMRCQRKILRIKWSQHFTNKHIRSVTKQSQLAYSIRNSRLKWFGHLLRMDNNRIPKRLHLWKLTQGKRRRWRPKATWTNVIKRDLLNLRFGWSIEEAKVKRILTSQVAGANMHDANW